MNNFTIRSVWISLFSFLLFVWAGNSLASTVKTKANKTSISIVFAADMPIMEDKLRGDFSNLAHLVNKQRIKNADTVFLFGGGSIGPSPMSSFDKGSHIIDILNTIEPDAMTVTKREFIYYEDELSMRAYEAGFPIVSTNLHDKTRDKPLFGLASHALVENASTKLAVISLINESVVEEYRLKKVEVLEPLDVVKSELELLKEQNADKTIVVTSYYDQDIEEVAALPEIDAVIITDTSLTDKAINKLQKHKKLIIYNEPNTALLLTLGNRTQYVDYISLSNIPQDEITRKQIEQYSNRLNRLLNTELGVFESTVITTKSSVRSEENGFGNLLADAMRIFVGSDIAIINGGVIRGNNIYAPGTTITRGLIATELPFRSRVVLIKVTGQQIVDALNNGVSKLGELKGRFPHVSGIEYSVSIVAGTYKVHSVRFNGKEIELERTYSVATSDYIATGGDGYTMLSGSRPISIGVRLTPLLSEVLVNYIQEKQVVKVQTEGRIKFD